MLFGEHPREMISPETGLNFLKAICNKSEKKYDDMDHVVDNYELRILLNANPDARKMVERGNYCRRENENNVDINRNYDSHWEYNKDDIT